MRLALNPEEAAAACGVSRDFFDKHMKPTLPVAYISGKRLITIRALERWLEENSTVIAHAA